MKTKRFYTIVITLAIAVSMAGAQTGSFTVSVDPNHVGVHEQFQVTFTFSGGDVNGVSNFKAPNFGSLIVMSGPSQSTSMQIVNGSISGSVSYTFVLYAQQTGKFTINSASIQYQGKTLSTQAVAIDVSQAKPQQKNQQQDQSGSNVNVGDNLFLKAVCDKSRVPQGEQVTVVFKLYTRVSVTSFNLTKAPTFDGFWSEDFDMPHQPQQTTETVNGKQYRVFTIKKTALFATQAGNLKIAPLEVQCGVQMQSKRRSNDPFDAFFNDPFFQQVQNVNVNIKSNPITIAVESIPSNAPAGYSGVIGQFTFSASADKKSVKAGDPITLRMVIAGSGNIKLATVPKLLLPADIESYDPKITEEISRDGGIIHGKKTAEYLLIPRNAGQRSIEPVSFVYYDLARRAYVTLRSPKFEFTILPGKDFSSSGTSIAAKEDVQLLGEDIRFIKLAAGRLERAEDTASHFWFFAGLIFAPCMFIGAWVYRRRMEKIYGDMPKLLFETAGREATKRLKKAKLLLEQGNAESYNAEILKALSEYLEHKLRISKANFAMEQAIERLQRHGVSDEVLQILKTCTERAEFSRYAPGTDTAEARKELIDLAANAINGIERSFGKKMKI
ncbi:MAG TPA: BatD family protein [Bacteroidota bacterium]|nr:BatD family protein [Bacteroidota bacterium]